MDNLKHHFTFANKFKSKYPLGPKVENTPEGGIAIAPIGVSVVAKVIKGLKIIFTSNHFKRMINISALVMVKVKKNMSCKSTSASIMINLNGSLS